MIPRIVDFADIKEYVERLVEFMIKTPKNKLADVILNFVLRIFGYKTLEIKLSDLKKNIKVI